MFISIQRLFQQANGIISYKILQESEFSWAARTIQPSTSRYTAQNWDIPNGLAEL
jgi:hypothetical protein